MLTHDELCRIGMKWLKSQGCSVRLSEMVSVAGEVPDVIGWKNPSSYLIECKCSVSDFLKDQKKVWRAHESMGMGDYRFYLTPTGLLANQSLPDKWGLLETDGKRVKVISGKPPRRCSHEPEFFFEKSKRSEIILLTSALRRAQEAANADP